MTDFDATLRSALPPSLHDAVPAIVQILQAAEAGDSTSEAIRARIAADPSLQQALQRLAGQRLDAGGRLIAFGAGSQVGDVSIGELAGGDIIKLTVNQAAARPHLSLDEQRDREAIMRKLRATWVVGLLERSRTELARIALGLTERPDLVASPFSDQAQELARVAEELPAGSTVVEVFKRCGGGLLIVGAPGSGKTTMLLELCAALLDRAERDEAEPFPVVFNLSSWGGRRAPLAEWIVHELAARYGVPTAIARRWEQAGMLVPMLDGLDEVAEEHRDDCVAAINQHRAGRLGSLVVCSRLADYERQAARLALDTAVLVHPPTFADAVAALAATGPELAALGETLAASDELRELAGTPLMLSVLARAGETLGPAELAALAARDQLWDVYFDAMFARRGLPEQGYAPAATRRRLAWLARRMQEQRETVFLIERLQPAWLETPALRRRYAIGEGLMASLTAGIGAGLYFGALGAARIGPSPIVTGWASGGVALLLYSLGVGIVAGVLGGLIFFALSFLMGAGLSVPTGEPPGRGALVRSAVQVSLAFGATVGMVVMSLYGPLLGLVTGLWLGPVAGALTVMGTTPGSIRPVERLRWRWGLAARGAAIGALAALPAGLTIAQVSPNPAALLVSGLCIIAGFTVIVGLRGSAIETRTAPNQGIRRSLRTALIAGGAIGLALGVVAVLLGEGMPLIVALSTRQRIVLGVIFGGASALFYGMVYGGAASAQHLLLRLILWRAGVAPWDYAQFLDHCDARVLLRKAGGGYLFIHRLLREHLAAEADPDPTAAAGSAGTGADGADSSPARSHRPA